MSSLTVELKVRNWTKFNVRAACRPLESGQWIQTLAPDIPPTANSTATAKSDEDIVAGQPGFSLYVNGKDGTADGMFTFESGIGGTQQFTVEGSIEEMRIVSRFRKLGDIIMCSVDIHESQ